MNRAILIVICDFLVSSMLSMMTGMVPAHTGGTGVGLDEATTRMLLAELETQRADLVKLRQKLREAAEKLGTSTPEQDAEMKRLTLELAKKIRQIQEVKAAQTRTAETTGKLTPEELKSLLDKEAEHRIAVELRLQDKQEDLSSAKQDLKQLQGAVANSNERIAELSKEHMKTQKELADTTAKAQVAEAAVKRQQQELSAKEQDLAGAKAALKEINARMGRMTNEKQTLQNTLAFTSGKLSNAEREAADYKGQVQLLQRALAEQKMESAVIRRQRDDMQQLVKRSVADASKTKQELDTAKKEVIATRKAAMDDQVKRQVAEGRMKDMERQLRNDVLTSYSEGILHLEMQLEEKRLISSGKSGGSYYLPVAAVGKRKLLIGSLGQLAGDADRPMVFQKVTKVEHLVSSPKGKNEKVRLAGPLLVSKRDPSLAALEVSGIPIQPLKIISAEALKKRGVQNLYLFQAGDFGKNSAELGGRCSLDLSGATPVLWIRNAVRGTGGGQLAAQEGDLVLTKEGDLVGIVINKNAYDLGRREEAHVALFSGDAEWDNVTALPLKKDAEGYYGAFGEGMRKLRSASR